MLILHSTEFISMLKLLGIYWYIPIGGGPLNMATGGGYGGIGGAGTKGVGAKLK